MSIKISLVLFRIYTIEKKNKRKQQFEVTMTGHFNNIHSKL